MLTKFCILEKIVKIEAHVKLTVLLFLMTLVLLLV